MVYCFLAHSGNVTVFGISGADGTFMCFCMYISVSYECLQHDFKKAFKCDVVGKRNRYLWRAKLSCETTAAKQGYVWSV